MNIFKNTKTNIKNFIKKIFTAEFWLGLMLLAGGVFLVSLICIGFFQVVSWLV